MQEGIGRNGYRLLGSVFFAIGLVGLAITWYAFNQVKQDASLYDWLGFGLTTIALVALYAVMLVLLARSQAAAQPNQATVSFRPNRPEATVPSAGVAPAPPLLPEAQPDNDPNVEFDDAVPVTTGPETLVPIPPLPRQAPILPPNRNLGMDTKGWPQRRGPSGITRREMMEQLRAGQSQTLSPGRPNVSVMEIPPEAEMDVPASPAPVAFSRNGSVPTILAKPATASLARNDGTSKGKCGGCGTMLLAPSQRPVNIKCPRCDKVTLIK